MIDFEEETISLQLQGLSNHTPIGDYVEKNGWKITPLNTMKVHDRLREDIMANDVILSVILMFAGVQEDYHEQLHPRFERSFSEIRLG